MFEDFVSALDDLGQAFIELNEIAKWLKAFHYDIGIQIEQTDRSDDLMKKLKVSPEEYKLNPKEDYWRGVSTILNSEVAALTRVLQISKEMNDNGDEVFFDKDFGPQS